MDWQCIWKGRKLMLLINMMWKMCQLNIKINLNYGNHRYSGSGGGGGAAEACVGDGQILKLQYQLFHTKLGDKHKISIMCNKYFINMIWTSMFKKKKIFTKILNNIYFVSPTSNSLSISSNSSNSCSNSSSGIKSKRFFFFF